MIIPLGLTDEQEHIYSRLYKKCDFETMTVKYTVQQLVNDSNKCFNLTTQKVRTILKFLINNNYLVEVFKGSKGNPTTYKIIKIQQLNNNNLTINQQQSNNQSIDIKPFIGFEQQQSNNNLTTNQQLINNPINEKENEKEKKDNILSFNNDCICETNDNNSNNEEENKKPKDNYIIEKEIFDYWNSKLGTIHSQERSFTKDKTKIKTAIKTYGKDEIITAIDRLDKAVLDTNYYYSFKWNLFKFLKQSNGITNWLDDGQLWNSYNANKEVLTSNNKSTGNNEEIEAFLRGDY